MNNLHIIFYSHWLFFVGKLHRPQKPYAYSLEVDARSIAHTKKYALVAYISQSLTLVALNVLQALVICLGQKQIKQLA